MNQIESEFLFLYYRKLVENIFLIVTIKGLILVQAKIILVIHQLHQQIIPIQAVIVEQVYLDLEPE